MAYNSISIKSYTKSHLELQREITLIELTPSPYFFVQSICLAYINMFARFDENPAMTLQDIKKTKRYGRTHGRTDNVKTVYPPQTKFAGGYNNVYLWTSRLDVDTYLIYCFFFVRFFTSISYVLSHS